MIIRPATVEDIPSILGLDRSSPAAHWTELQYHQLFQPRSGASHQRLVLIVEGWQTDISIADERAEMVVLAFLVARHVASEWELENIVVAETARRMGLGKQLLEALLTRATETKSDAVFLEVRESNASARALYESSGFEPTGHRTAYYTNPFEDAVLYRRLIG